MTSLDAKDKKILYHLEMDARQPLAVLAKKVGLSREVVNYRIGQLEKKGIIEYYVTVVDYVLLGYIFCRVWFKYHNVSKEIEEKIIEYAKSNKNISWAIIGEGQFNNVLVFLVKNVNKIEEDIDEFKLKFGEYVKNIFPSIAFKIYHFKHTYLYANKDREPIIVGDHSNLIEISESDLLILNELVTNPKIKNIDLAKKSNVNVKTITKKIDYFKNKGLIKQFKIKINTNLLGFEHQKVFLFFKHTSLNIMNNIISALKFDPRVIFITKAFGLADLEFEIIVKSKRELFEFMREIRSKFPEAITDYETFLIYDEPFSKYLVR